MESHKVLMEKVDGNSIIGEMIVRCKGQEALLEMEKKVVVDIYGRGIFDFLYFEIE